MSELTAEDIELTIDEEFSALVPAHTPAEADEFRKNVEEPGRYHYPILFWKEGQKNLVVDGRHRYQHWCSLPPDTPIPPPQVREVFYPDRDAVKKAILRDRLGRSNVDSKTRKVLTGRLYNEEKRSAAKNLKSGKNTRNSPNRHSGGNAARTVSRETNTPARTVERYGARAAALDTIGMVNSKAKSDIESGSLKVADKDVIAIAKLGANEIGKALANVRHGKPWKDGLNPSKPEQKPKPAGKADLKDLDKAVGAVSRALLKAGKAHGEGPHYQAIFTAVASIKRSVAEWMK